VVLDTVKFNRCVNLD